MFRAPVTRVALVLVALGMVGCSSDSSSPTTSSTPHVVATLATTSTTAAGGASTSVTPTGSTVAGATSSTTASATATTTAASRTTVAGRVVSSPSDSVRQGDSGPGVTKIQQALVAHGYKVATDGKFGPQTSTAVKAFQTANKLKADGIVGPVTWAKLSAAPGASTTSNGSTTVKPTSTTVKTTTTTVKSTTTTTA